MQDGERKRTVVASRQHTMRLTALSITVVLALSGFQAQAGESEDKASARAHFERAARLYEVKEFTDALAEFKAAYVAKPDPAFLFNIAQCHRNLGHAEEAVTFYRRFLQHAPANDPNRAQVETLLRRAQDDAVFKEDMEASASSAGVSTAALDSPFASDDVSVATPQPVPAPAPVERAPARSPKHARPELARAVDRADDGYALRVAGMVCGAAGIASIGAGIYFYTRARHYSDVVSNDPNHTAADVTSGQNAETAQWVFYGVGAATIVAGGVLSWFGWTSVHPVVTPNAVALSIGGTY